jgi:hypothetical protein
LQKTELAESRAALVASHQAQADQAKTALIAARISTLNIQLSLTAAQLKHYRGEKASLDSRLNNNRSNKSYPMDALTQQLRRDIGLCTQILAELTDREDDLIIALEAIARGLDLHPVSRTRARAGNPVAENTQ